MKSEKLPEKMRSCSDLFGRSVRFCFHVVRLTLCFVLQVKESIGWAQVSDPGLLSRKSGPRLRVPSTSGRSLPAGPKHQSVKTFLVSIKSSSRQRGWCLVIYLKCSPCGCQIPFQEIQFSRCHRRDKSQNYLMLSDRSVWWCLIVTCCLSFTFFVLVLFTEG